MSNQWKHANDNVETYGIHQVDTMKIDTESYDTRQTVDPEDDTVSEMSVSDNEETDSKVKKKKDEGAWLPAVDDTTRRVLFTGTSDTEEGEGDKEETPRRRLYVGGMRKIKDCCHGPG